MDIAAAPLLLVKEEDSALRDFVTIYVYNTLPIRMIRLNDMELVGRNAVIGEIMEALRMDTEVTAALRTKSNLEAVKKRIICVAQETAGYVVLSHTWLVGEEEVIYEETHGRPGWQADTELITAKKMSYAKLQGFCRTARSAPYNARYGWVDTICINKSSTSELDESIRSMYRWYLNSSVCIVYLAETQGSHSLDHMERDRWFRRGWTLQEYLAPKVIKFHDRSWVPLTDYLLVRNSPESQNDKYPHAGLPPRASLTLIQAKVEQATGIPPFPGSPTDDDSDIPSGRRLIQQMQWAARRETTREEDRAYGLMGIFHVSFPVAYGEGGERAFFRLIEALLANKPAEQVCALLAWAGRPIARAIHTSRMLPSAPECYRAPAPPQGPQPSFVDGLPDWLAVGAVRLPPEPTILTHIGLRMRLLIVHAVLTSEAGAFDGRLVHFMVRSEVLKFKRINVHLHAQYPVYPKGREIYPVSAHHPPLAVVTGMARSTENPQFLLAMYTFIEGNDAVRIPRSGLGFLLAWYPPADSPWLRDADMASAYLGAWSKIDTQRPVVFERDVNSKDGYTTILKKELAHVGSMVLASLYL